MWWALAGLVGLLIFASAVVLLMEMRSSMKMEQARMRHPASRPQCPRCRCSYWGPVEEHTCPPGL